MTKKENSNRNWHVVFATSTAIFLIVAAYISENFSLLLISPSPLLWWLGKKLPRYEPFTTPAISTLLTLAAADAALPYLFPSNVNRTYANGYYRKTDIGSQASPGVYPSKEIGRNGEIIYDVRYTISDDGFRVTPENKSKSEKHINFYGCSFTYGEGLNDNETIPYFVMKELDDSSVKNWAFHGYGMHQALAIMESNRDTQGDVNVIVAAPWQAARSACKPWWTGGSPRYKLIDQKIVRDGACEPTLSTLFILHNSNIYQKISELLNQRKTSREDIELYLALVKKIADLSHERGQRLIIAYIKADDVFLAGLTNDEIYSSLSQYGEIVDVTLATTPQKIPRKYYFSEQDRHPTKAANEERAKLIAAVISKHSSGNK